MKTLFIITAFTYAAILWIIESGTSLENRLYVLLGAMVAGAFVLIISSLQKGLTVDSHRERQRILQNAVYNAMISVVATLVLTFFILQLLEVLANWYFPEQAPVVLFQQWPATLAVGFTCMLFGFQFRAIVAWAGAKIGKVNITIGKDE